MKLKPQLILLCICGCLLLGAENLFASQPGFFYENCKTLIEQPSFDGLDARDANNQPIKTQQAVDGLTEIFESGLFNLLTASELYTEANILGMLEKTLKLASENLTKNIPESVNNVIASLLPVLKQLQKPIICLAGLLCFALIIFKFAICNLQFEMPLVYNSPVVLRI
jgi:hypothetical protein